MVLLFTPSHTDDIWKVPQGSRRPQVEGAGEAMKMKPVRTQRYDSIRGHPDNWPRRIARKYDELDYALNALMEHVDEGNQNFALIEFIRERVIMATREVARKGGRK